MSKMSPYWPVGELAFVITRKRTLCILWIGVCVSVILHFAIGNLRVKLRVSSSSHTVIPGPTMVSSTIGANTNDTQYGLSPVSADSEYNNHIRKLSERLTLSVNRNNSNLARIRKEIRRFRSSVNSIILAKNNIVLGERLTYSSIQREHFHISAKLYNILPTTSSVVDRRHRSCSVVGNSGIILGSGCGRRIDKAEYVYRCNAAPINPHVKDAGRKSNFVTFNRSIMHKRYGGLRTVQNRTKLKNEINGHNLIWLPVYSQPSIANSYITLAYLLRYFNIPVVVMHPTHMIETRRHWKKWGINKIMSTGFYLVSVAIELCDEVQLYGFWPFTVSPRGKPVSYHYYDDLNFTTTHNFSAEFDVLVKLHELGVVELNVDCH